LSFVFLNYEPKNIKNRTGFHLPVITGNGKFSRFSAFPDRECEPWMDIDDQVIEYTHAIELNSFSHLFVGKSGHRLFPCSMDYGARVGSKSSFIRLLSTISYLFMMTLRNGFMNGSWFVSTV